MSVPSLLCPTLPSSGERPEEIMAVSCVEIVGRSTSFLLFDVIDERPGLAAAP